MTVVRRFFEPPKGSFFLFGPRGSGKSLWASTALPDAVRIDLLDPETFRELSARPERLRARIGPSPDGRNIVLDEVQRIPELLPVVHGLIEERRGLRFVLTGSSARKLRRHGVDLLGGRAAVRTLHPFLAAELGDRFSLARGLTEGLVPLIVDAVEPHEALRGYVALYLREEVQLEGLVRNLGSFSRFLETVSFSQGQPINLAAVARECQVSRTAAVGYLSILEDLLLCFQVPVFSRRARRELSVHPKFFYFDCGVYRSLRPAGPLDRPEEIEGPALEGLVAQHLRAWIAYRGDTETLSYWRTRSGVEVDFVIYGRDVFAAVEVKNTRRIRPEDLRGLRAFGEDYPKATRLLLYRGIEREVHEGVLCLPTEEFLTGLDPRVTALLDPVRFRSAPA